MTYIPSKLRQLVYARAKACCEYCLIPEAISLAPYEIDHIIAEKHGGSTTEDNLALSCTLCNKHKGSDVASRAFRLTGAFGLGPLCNTQPGAPWVGAQGCALEERQVLHMKHRYNT